MSLKHGRFSFCLSTMQFSISTHPGWVAVKGMQCKNQFTDLAKTMPEDSQIANPFCQQGGFARCEEFDWGQLRNPSGSMFHVLSYYFTSVSYLGSSNVRIPRRSFQVRFNKIWHMWIPDSRCSIKSYNYM